MVTLQKLARIFKRGKEERKKLISFYKKHKKEYDDIDFIIEDQLDSFLDALLNTKHEPHLDEQLFLAEFQDCIIEDDLSVEYFNVFDVSIYCPRTNYACSTLTYPFEELANTYIYQPSLIEYGCYRCFLELTRPITGFGLTKEESNKNQDDFFDDLQERCENLKNGNYIDTEELYDEFGLTFEEPSEEYNVKFKEASKKCDEHNKKILESLKIPGGAFSDGI